MKLALPMTLLCLTLPAQAVLAPNYQRLAELKAILDEPAVVSAFDVYHPIDSIAFVHKDLYRVSAGGCHIDVTISDKPTKPGVIGARQFNVTVGKKVCE